ncbi:MAG: hypothetical protein R2748_07850 [Bryobacterales bacterium]
MATGTSGRNILDTPGIRSLDMTLSKEIPLNEKVKAQFRVEAYNFTNTPQFGTPNSNVNNNDFMRVTSTSGSINQDRQFRLGLRWILVSWFNQSNLAGPQLGAVFFISGNLLPSVPSGARWVSPVHLMRICISSHLHFCIPKTAHIVALFPWQCQSHNEPWPEDVFASSRLWGLSAGVAALKTAGRDRYEAGKPASRESPERLSDALDRNFAAGLVQEKLGCLCSSSLWKHGI